MLIKMFSSLSQTPRHDLFRPLVFCVPQFKPPCKSGERYLCCEMDNKVNKIPWSMKKKDE